jgi:pimeloyl-ACP methyl ester carboxylesterase
VLFLYGEADTVVPPSENAARMAELVRAARATILVFPRANHTLDVSAGLDPSGEWRFPRRAPGSFEALDAWLRANVR